MMKQVTFNTTKTKILNTELVTSALIQYSASTRKRIADVTGLSVATCGNILNELIDRGEAFEQDTTESNGGRPAKCYIYNPDHSYVAGLYIDQDKDRFIIHQAVANMVGEIIEERSEQTDTFSRKDLDERIKDLLDRYNKVKAIGIGVPGVVRDGVVVNDCSIPDLIDYPLEKKLSDRYKIKVIVGNDMNLIALGFYRELGFTTSKNIAVVNFPTESCYGSGIIVDGHILKGNTNFAGEISFLPLEETREELLRQQSNPEKNRVNIIKTAVSLIAIINPDTLVLTGDSIRSNQLDEILAGCRKTIPDKHMPRIIIREDIQDEYIKGLIDVTLKSLGCEIQLIKRRI